MGFYLQCAQRAGGPILEPMCGSGRFLVPLARRGFDVDGTDASPQMLGACRAKCRELGLNPALYQQLLHELALPRRYALVMIPAGSFGLITEQAQILQSLRRIRAHMIPGGTFVLELDRHRLRPSGSSPWGGRWVTRADGAKIVISWLTHYDAQTRIARSIHRYELIKDGRLIETEFEDFELLAHDPVEFAELLKQSGFEQIGVMKLYDNRAPDDADEEFLMTCAARPS